MSYSEEMQPAGELTRRQLVGRGALVAAALALPGASPLDALGAAKPTSIHCLPPADLFEVKKPIGAATFLAFSADAARVACTTLGGLRVRPRKAGQGAVVAPPGFAVGSGDAWHPDGSVILATGPNGAGQGIFAVRPNGTGIVPLLGDLPGRMRAPCFSPDGTKVAFTYVDRFLHRLVIADWVGGAAPALVNPRVLNPFDPINEGDPGRLRQGFAYHETRSFTPDGRGLIFGSDRGGGMLNVQLHRLDMATGAVRQLTREDGFVEGGFVGRGGRTLYYGSTRAREPAFLSLVTGPELPPLLGFAATQALHDQVVADFRAPIGNGDVLAANAPSGLSARVVARRDVIARPVGGGAGTNHRIIACAMSRDGRFLAAAAVAPSGTGVTILERGPKGIPRAQKVLPTPVPPTAQPLVPGTLGDKPIERSITGLTGGRVNLTMNGSLDTGTFDANFSGYSEDGLTAFSGPIHFDLDGLGNVHTADVGRLSDESEQDATEARVFYRVNSRVLRPDTAGDLISRSSRYATLHAVGTGRAFAPLGTWKPGRRSTPIGLPGALPCPKGAVPARRS